MTHSTNKTFLSLSETCTLLVLKVLFCLHKYHILKRYIENEIHDPIAAITLPLNYISFFHFIFIKNIFIRVHVWDQWYINFFC